MMAHQTRESVRDDENKSEESKTTGWNTRGPEIWTAIKYDQEWRNEPIQNCPNSIQNEAHGQNKPDEELHEIFSFNLMYNLRCCDQV